MIDEEYAVDSELMNRIIQNAVLAAEVAGRLC